MIYNFFKKIHAASDYSAIAEGIDGFIYNTGINYEGCLGNGITTDCKVPQLTKVEIEDIKDMTPAESVQDNRTYILKNDNTLWACGGNTYGQLGLGHTDNVTGFKKTLDNVKCISSRYFGNEASFAIKNDNTLWVCGDNYYGQLGISTNNEERIQLTWVQSNIDNIKEIYPTENCSLAVKNDNTLWVTGTPARGSSIGVGKDVETEGEWIHIGDDVKKVIAANYRFVVLKNDGTLWVCGDNSSGAAATENLNEEEIWTYKKLDNIDMSNIKYIIVGNEATFFLKNDGTLWTCGYNGMGQLGVGNYDDVVTITQICDNVKEVACGVYHTLVLKNDGTLWG